MFVLNAKALFVLELNATRNVNARQLNLVIIVIEVDYITERKKNDTSHSSFYTCGASTRRSEKCIISAAVVRKH
jgi:hypothetical protein